MPTRTYFSEYEKLPKKKKKGEKLKNKLNLKKDQ